MELQISLTQMAFKTAGLSLPRTTSEQARVGVPVPDLASIQAGDLIFISGSDGSPIAPGHVGLAISRDLLVQAPHTGTSVQVTKIADWAASVTAIRRVAG